MFHVSALRHYKTIEWLTPSLFLCEKESKSAPCTYFRRCPGISSGRVWTRGPFAYWGILRRHFGGQCAFLDEDYRGRIRHDRPRDLCDQSATLLHRRHCIMCKQGGGALEFSFAFTSGFIQTQWVSAPNYTCAGIIMSASNQSLHKLYVLVIKNRVR